MSPDPSLQIDGGLRGPLASFCRWLARRRPRGPHGPTQARQRQQWKRKPGAAVLANLAKDQFERRELRQGARESLTGSAQVGPGERVDPRAVGQAGRSSRRKLEMAEKELRASPASFDPA